MFVLDLNEAIKNIDGSDLKDSTGAVAYLHKAIATHLAQSKTDDPIRYRRIAEKLYDKGTVELETVELDTLESVMKKSNLNDLALAPFLEKVETLRDEKKKSRKS